MPFQSITALHLTSQIIQLSETSSNECSADESHFKLDLMTDDFGSQTRWILKKTGQRDAIMRGPPSGTTYDSNSNFVRGVCLPPGAYRFIIFDSGKDGLNVPDTNSGSYAVYLGEKKVAGSPRRRKHWRKRLHKFTVASKTPAPKPKPASKPTSKPSVDVVAGGSSEVVCSSAERMVQLEIKTDRWGGDTSWEVAKEGEALIESNKVYGSHETELTHFCLKKGSTYDFVLRDKVGDGLCCSHGEGYFKVALLEEDGSWKEIIKGGSFQSKELMVGINLKESTMTVRDAEWLDSHNRRREKWHLENGKDFGKQFFYFRFTFIIVSNAELSCILSSFNMEPWSER